MPELPEVEVVKKSLQSIHKLKIKKIQINNINLRYPIEKKKLLKLQGKKILSISRKSKYLILNFDNNKSLVIHLGMTGRFYFKKKKNLKNTSFYFSTDNKIKKHDHVIFHFSNKLRLIYNDIRRFGFFLIMNKKDIQCSSIFSKLGPEPLSKKFNFSYFDKKYKNKKKNIKNLLMDQKFVSGLGNIYVNEILYLSKINPFKLSKSLKEDDLKNIIKFTKLTISKAVSLGGSSIRDFSDTNNQSGKYQDNFFVYGREGLKCKTSKCVSIINRKFISNRSTFYCKICQK